MRRTTKVYAIGLLIVCMAMVAGYSTHRADRDFTVYDDNFKILDCGISRGTKHMFYHGNPTVGRVRAKLRNEFGLKFIGLSSTALDIGIGGPGGRLAFVRYKGNFPVEELDGLKAVLTNGKNISTELDGYGARVQDQGFIRCYHLPSRMRSDYPIRIDFKLKSANEPIASWRVGELNAHVQPKEVRF